MALPAALPFKTCTAGDRLCTMSPQGSRTWHFRHSGGIITPQLSKDQVKMICEWKRDVVTCAIRHDKSPARAGDDDHADAAKEFRLSRSTTARTVNKVTAQAATTKTTEFERDATRAMDELTRDFNPEEGEVDDELIYCDILPRSIACRALELASRFCEEVEKDFAMLGKSKKPHRLSTTSWDLLD